MTSGPAAARHGSLHSTGSLSGPQRARRDRIMAAAAELASAGGYDGVAMRDVAERADVALGTLYRYFPSKVHLLVGLMQDATQRLAERQRERPPAGATAADRVVRSLTRAVDGLQREPQLSEAMTRALMFADTSAADEVHAVTVTTTDMIIDAMAGTDREPTPDDGPIARVIEQVWLSSILAWLSGRATITQLSEDLEIATRLLLRDG